MKEGWLGVDRHNILGKVSKDGMCEASPNLPCDWIAGTWFILTSYKDDLESSQNTMSLVTLFMIPLFVYLYSFPP